MKPTEKREWSFINRPTLNNENRNLMRDDTSNTLVIIENDWLQFSRSMLYDFQDAVICELIAVLFADCFIRKSICRCCSH